MREVDGCGLMGYKADGSAGETGMAGLSSMREGVKVIVASSLRVEI